MRGWMIFIIIVGVFLVACDHEPMDDDTKPTPCELSYTGPLDILWHNVLRTDSSQHSSIMAGIYPNDILFNNNSTGELNTLYSFHPDTGEKQWEFDDLPSGSDFVSISALTPPKVFDQKLYFNHGVHKILFDVEKREKDWQVVTGFAETDVTRIGNYLYYIQFFDDLGGDVISGSEIRRVREDQVPGWEAVFRLDDQHIFRIPAPWVNSSGDTLLIFRSSNFPFPGTVDAFAYNISKDELAWSITDFSNFSGTKHAPIIHEDKAFFQMQRGVACLDLLTGTALWETPDLEDTFTSTNPVLTEELLIVKGDQKGKTFALNIHSGAIIWETEDTGMSAPNMWYWGGAVYFMASVNFESHLYGLDIQTGEIFLKELPPFKDCYPTSVFNTSHSIDPEMGRMYAYDGIFAYCIQLEER